MTEVTLPTIDPAGTPRHPRAISTKSKTVGVSALKQRKAERAAATIKTTKRPMDALIGREQILAGLHALLAKAETGMPQGDDDDDSEAGDYAGGGAAAAEVQSFEGATQPPQAPSLGMVPHPPTGPPSRQASRQAHLSRPDTAGSGISGGSQSNFGLPPPTPPAGGSKPNPPSRRASASRDFLATVLAPNKDAQQANKEQHDALPQAAVPSWKEEIVERCARASPLPAMLASILGGAFEGKGGIVER